MTTPTLLVPAHVITNIEAAILADIRSGKVPPTVRSWEELANHVDTNEYTDRCVPWTGNYEQWIAHINAACEEVRKWLANLNLCGRCYMELVPPATICPDHTS